MILVQTHEECDIAETHTDNALTLKFYFSLARLPLCLTVASDT